MANVAINSWGDVARIYKGYFSIHDGNDTYTYQQLVDLEETITQNVSDHYGTKGAKKLAATGFSAQYRVKIDSTADLYSADENTDDKKTITYFLNKLFDHELTNIQFEAVEKADAEADNFIRTQFRGAVIGSQKSRDSASGTYTHTITLEITEKISAVRKSS